MKLRNLLILGMAGAIAACSSENTEQEATIDPEMEALATASDILPVVPDGAQAMSALGEPLFPGGMPSDALLENLAEAKANYDADPNDAMNIIWYGRRVAYTGDYRRAIEIFTEGIEKHPTDARMDRHRGHRRDHDRRCRRPATCSGCPTARCDRSLRCTRSP